MKDYLSITLREPTDSQTKHCQTALQEQKDWCWLTDILQHVKLVPEGTDRACLKACVALLQLSV